MEEILQIPFALVVLRCEAGTTVDKKKKNKNTKQYLSTFPHSHEKVHIWGPIMHHQLCHLYFGLAKDNHVSALLPTFSFFFSRTVSPLRSAHLLHLYYPATICSDNKMMFLLPSFETIILNGGKAHILHALFFNRSLPTVKTSLLQNKQQLRAFCICFQHHRCYY